VCLSNKKSRNHSTKNEKIKKKLKRRKEEKEKRREKKSTNRPEQKKDINGIERNFLDFLAFIFHEISYNVVINVLKR
jgi:hypothetical protein